MGCYRPSVDSDDSPQVPSCQAVLQIAGVGFSVRGSRLCGVWGCKLSNCRPVPQSVIPSQTSWSSEWAKPSDTQFVKLSMLFGLQRLLRSQGLIGAVCPPLDRGSHRVSRKLLTGSEDLNSGGRWQCLLGKLWYCSMLPACSQSGPSGCEHRR